MVNLLVVWGSLGLGCAEDPAPKVSEAPAVEPEAAPPELDVQVVGVPVTFARGASVGARFTWDFGDGSSAEGDTVSHTYTTPGRFTVKLTAWSEDGRSDVGNLTAVLVNPPLVVPPGVSGRLVRLGDRLFAALPEEDQVVVVQGDVVVDRLGVCGSPTALSVVTGSLWVVCRDDEIQRWDPVAGTQDLSLTLPWGARPVAVVAEPEGGAWVTMGGSGALWWVDAEGLGEHVLAVPDPGGLAASAGVVYAARFRSPDAGGEIVKIEEGSGETWVLLADPGPDSDTDARGLPNLLGAVALRPDGGALVVAGTKANIARGLNRDGLAYTFETATRAALRLVDPADGSAVARALFDNRDRVGAVAFTPMGDQLLVAHLGAGVVDLLDPLTLTRLGGFQDVGRGLDGVVSDGESAWVLASLDRELVRYSLGGVNGEQELARVSLAEGAPADPVAWLGAQVFAGAGDRRMSQDAYVSCASCHPDGGTDGRTWDFTDRGEGFRDTQALWAMPSGGPFHWSANFDEIQDFENAIRDHQSGTGFLDDVTYAACRDPLGAPKSGYSSELDALAAYVLGLERPRSPYRLDDGSPSEAGARGAEVFANAGCGDCHAGPELTDAGWGEDGSPILHDVGTLLPTSGGRAGGVLTGLRTPSLRGLFASAPYLHDGRAGTLEEALIAHGIGLSAEDQGDLVQFLLEIE